MDGEVEEHIDRNLKDGWMCGLNENGRKKEEIMDGKMD